MARQLANLDLFARLYIELELEMLAQSGDGPDAHIARETFENRWTDWDVTKRVQLGSRILTLRKAFKAFQDAEHQLNYAGRYRGANDDFLADGDWRSSFGCYEERANKLLQAARELVNAVQDVTSARNEPADDPGTVALTGMSNKMKEYVQNLHHDRRFAHDDMYRASEARIEMLEAQEKPPSQPEPEEPVYEPPETGHNLDVDMADYDDLEPAWHGKLLLGSGSYGSAYLWLKTNAQGRITQRLVQKVCDLTPLWYRNVWWTNGAPGSSGMYRKTIPNEIQSHLNLAGKPGSRSVVELLNYNLRLQDRAADLYLEFCPFGDAFGLLKRGYSCLYHGERERCDFEDQRAECKFIPEPFCWSAFRSLALAGSLMGRGTIDSSSEAADPDWEVIVHRDLKLDNVFLGVPAPDAFPGYPQLKIADFGGAVLIPPNDPRPPEALLTLKTSDHASPEMDCALKRGRRNAEITVRQSSQTNVWGIGIIMYSLLAGRQGPTHPHTHPSGYFLWDVPSRREPPAFDLSTRNFYSDTLLDLVLACLRYDDRDRPSVEFLVRECKRYTNPGPDPGPNCHFHSEGQEGQEKEWQDLAAGMKTLGPGREGYEEMYGRSRFALEYREDGYACGLSFQEVPFVGQEEDVPVNLKDLL